MGARAAVRVVGRVAEAGDASGLAADDGAARVGGARELSGAVGVEVYGAVRDGAALVVVNADGDVEAIDERDCDPDHSVLRTRQDTALREVTLRRLTIVPVLVAVALEGELGDGGGGDTGAGVGVALETAVAATISARVGAGVGGEVAVATTPDAAGLPVVRDCEGDGLAGRLLPSSGLVGDGGADVQVSEELVV